MPVRIFADKEGLSYLREVWLVCEHCSKIFERFSVFEDRITPEFRKMKPICPKCFKKV